MSAFRKKPVVIKATQWFKNGDHPEDRFSREGVLPEGYEGGVVRYFRNPDVPGYTPCEQCGQAHHVHGWIDTLEQGHRVCPGDWIITGVKGERYPCKPDIFTMTYEPADQPAPQGVAAVAGTHDAFAMIEALQGAYLHWGGWSGTTGILGKMKSAITALVQERDDLKAQVEELGKELTCLPDMRDEIAWQRNRIAELEALYLPAVSKGNST